jgi:hypothetical protein
MTNRDYYVSAQGAAFEYLRHARVTGTCKSRLPHRPARPAARRPAPQGDSSRGALRGAARGGNRESFPDDLGPAKRFGAAGMSSDPLRSRRRRVVWRTEGRTRRDCGDETGSGGLPVGDRRSGRWQGGSPVGPADRTDGCEAWQRLGGLDVGSRRAVRQRRLLGLGPLDPPGRGVRRPLRGCIRRIGRDAPLPGGRDCPNLSRAGGPKGFPRRQARVPSDGTHSVGSRSSAPDASFLLRFKPATHAPLPPAPASRPKRRGDDAGERTARPSDDGDPRLHHGD